MHSVCVGGGGGSRGPLPPFTNPYFLKKTSDDATTTLLRCLADKVLTNFWWGWGGGGCGFMSLSDTEWHLAFLRATVTVLDPCSTRVRCHLSLLGGGGGSYP